MAIYFKESDWVAVRRCAEADGVAVVPLGSLEQHGPHLPCGVDSIDEVMARMVARLDPELPVCVCPTVDYSVVQWASPLASAGIAPKTMEQSLVDICHALTDLGFSKIVLVHGHGGLPTGRSALWQAMYEKRPALYVDFEPYDRCQAQIAQIVGGPDGHGGTAETSMMLAIRPDLVDVSKAGTAPVSLWGDDFPFPSLEGVGSYPIPSIESLSDGFYGGDVRLASAEKGHKILDLLAGSAAEVVGELASAPTPAEYKHVWRKSLPSEA
ncbi:MAG: creatininase family protein [Candidatus Brocadiia bacterium]|nr:creatininase family protein [Candidatus Brocadiia bacterium]